MVHLKLLLGFSCGRPGSVRGFSKIYLAAAKNQLEKSGASRVLLACAPHSLLKIVNRELPSTVRGDVLLTPLHREKQAAIKKWAPLGHEPFVGNEIDAMARQALGFSRYSDIKKAILDGRFGGFESLRQSLEDRGVVVLSHRAANRVEEYLRALEIHHADAAVLHFLDAHKLRKNPDLAVDRYPVAATLFDRIYPYLAP